MSFKELFGFNSAKPEKKTESEKLSPKEIDELAKRIRIVDPGKRVVKGGQEKEKEQDGDQGLSRRQFLKALGLAGATAAVGTAGLKLAEIFSTAEPQAEEEKETEEQREIAEADIKSVTQALDFKKPGRLEFNLNTAEAIKNYWKKYYQESPKLKSSLTNAYSEMGYWEPYLRKIFKDKNLPEELRYLAIPESHWQPEAVSRAGAVGPYQFMKKTALDYGLRVDQSVDERKDPLKSARAGADLLKDLYQKTGDWNLSLSGYNGSFLLSYLKEIKETEKKPSYGQFLKYIEEKLNQTREEVKNTSFINYWVGRKENLNQIADKFKIDKSTVLKLNKIKNEKLIKAGQRIGIPLSQEQKGLIYQNRIKGYAENLNYPAKFKAIIELINEGFVTDQKKGLSFEVRQIKQQQKSYNYYTVKKGDTLYSLSNRFKMKIEDFKKENAEQLKTGLKAGNQLKYLSHRPEVITLANLARKVNRPISRLIFLNPALRSNTPIPDGYQIRV